MLFAPFDVSLSQDTNLQPDLLVARTEDLTERNLPLAPLLAVEVRSPSTATLDRTFKKAVYERYRTRAYSIVDPVPQAPSLVAFRLGEDARYDDGTSVTGMQEYRTDVPFPFSIRPRDLIPDR